MVYEKVSPDMKFVEREKEVEKFWKDNDVFQKSIEIRKEGLRQLTESLISDTFLHVLSRI